MAILNSLVGNRYGFINELIPMLNYPNLPNYYAISPMGYYSRNLGENIAVSQNKETAEKFAIYSYIRSYVYKKLKICDEAIYISCGATLEEAVDRALFDLIENQFSIELMHHIHNLDGIRIQSIEKKMYFVQVESGLCCVIKEMNINDKYGIFTAFGKDINESINKLETRIATIDILKANLILKDYHYKENKCYMFEQNNFTYLSAAKQLEESEANKILLKCYSDVKQELKFYEITPINIKDNYEIVVVGVKYGEKY